MSGVKKVAIVGVGGMTVGVMGLSFILVAVALAKASGKPSPEDEEKDREVIQGCLATVVAVAAAGFIVALIVLCVGRARVIGHAKRFMRSDQQHYDAIGPRIKRQQSQRHARQAQQRRPNGQQR